MKIVKSQKNSSGKLEIVLEISSDESLSFLEQEEQLALLLNQVGQQGMEELISIKDEDSPVLEVLGKKFYKKGHQKKSTKRPTAK